MYKILFIDEQQDDMDSFMDYVEGSNDKDKLDVKLLLPQPTLEAMVNEIFSHNPDAVVTDYMLNEIKETIKYNVPYTGVELVKKMLSIREDFPCFVMTSFDDMAVKESDDVNLVYVKKVLHGSEKDVVKATFLSRMLNQIDHYQARINKAEGRLLELIQLRKDGKASLTDEKEMIDLDQFLEHSLNKENAIPKEFKELSNTDRLTNILSKVEELLKRIEKK